MATSLTDRLHRDLSYALRSLGRTPAFTFTSILILALGIGMSTAMFTVFQSVLVERLPVQDQNRIVEVSGVAKGARDFPVFGEQLTRFRQQTSTLQGIAAFSHFRAVSQGIIDGDRQFNLKWTVVTGNFFQVLGARPTLGRLFQPDDERDYNPTTTDPNGLVAVISFDAWRKYFGRDSAVIGHRIRLPSIKWNPVIVGVAPPGLDYPRGIELWTPNKYNEENLVARMKPGVTLEAVRGDYLAFARNDPDNIAANVARTLGARVESLDHMIVGEVKPALLVLMAAVGLLLLLACVNVGNLLLLRAAGRGQELAVRRALGAGSADIVKQLVVESGLLGVAGGVFGFVLANTLLQALVRFAPPGLPRLDMIRISTTPLVAATVATGLSVLLFGVFPALGVGRSNLSSSLRFDTRSGTEGRRFRAVRRALVTSQIALALLLLSGAGLLLRSFVRLSALDMGYVPAHLSVVDVSMGWDRWLAQCGGVPPPSDSAASVRMGTCVNHLILGFHERLVQQVKGIPGVEKVSPVAVPPFLGAHVFMLRLRAEGQTMADAEKNPWVGHEWVGPEYFDALELPILRGRGFTDADRGGAPDVAIVSKGIARQLWPGQDPIGKRIHLGEKTFITVIGLVRDIHYREHRDPTPMMIRPYLQGFAQGHLIVRTRGAVPNLPRALQDAVHKADPGSDFLSVQTMDDLIAPQLAQPRLNALLLSAFALAAVLLAAIGLYGIMASAVSQQTRELGVRMALGATPNRLRRMVLGEALTIAGAGAIAGLAAALAASRVLRTMLFEVSPTDPETLIGVSLLLLGISLLAAYLPARRATRIDPARALKAE